MNVVRLADTAPQPWRNGGGTTQELLTWPAAGDWLLRVSVARIEQDGGFSAFPSFERWFAVVAGAGVALHLPGGESSLSPTSEPQRFDGAAAPHCRLLGGATQDLNLMLRQDRGQGGMRRATAGSRATAQAGWRALYTADPLTLDLDGAVMPVEADTLLWLAGDERVGWQVQDDQRRAWWLHWSPR